MRPYSEYETDEKKKFQITRGMVILAALVLIIAIVVIVMIFNAVNKNKENEYTNEDFEKLEQRMLEEAPIYVSQKQILLTDKETKIDLKDLLLENGGAIDKSKLKAARICEGYVIAVKQEQEKYSSYIKCGNEYTTYGYVSNESNEVVTTTKSQADTTAPTIVLKGDKEININVGQTFEEPGFTATDNIDGDITSEVKKEGTVNTQEAGTYTILYTVSDEAENKAEEKRVIRVIPTTTTTQASVTTTKKNTTTKTTTSKTTVRPTTPPTITLYGDKTITLNVGDWYNDPGYSAYDSLGSNITSSVKVSGNVNTSSTGTYYVTYSVTDRYGNYSSINRTVIVKTTSVALKGISISPNAIELNKGEEKTLTVYYTPSNATDKLISWSSSNPSVATISNGVVYAKARGTATITAKSSNGKTASAKVTVK